MNVAKLLMQGHQHTTTKDLPQQVPCCRVQKKQVPAQACRLCAGPGQPTRVECSWQAT